LEPRKTNWNPGGFFTSSKPPSWKLEKLMLLFLSHGEEYKWEQEKLKEEILWELENLWAQLLLNASEVSHRSTKICECCYSTNKIMPGALLLPYKSQVNFSYDQS
jgi:hypothetical protein